MTGDGSWLIRGVTIPGHSEQPTSILIDRRVRHGHRPGP